MMTFINGRICRLWVLYWISRTVWKQVTGRWFFFRDAPDVIVRMFSMALANEKLSDDLAMVANEAKAEWKLRIASRKRGVNE